MTLEDIRNEIQDIDYQILGLMKRRLELARLVGEDKIARNAAVRNIPQEDRRTRSPGTRLSGTYRRRTEWSTGTGASPWRMA